MRKSILLPLLLSLALCADAQLLQDINGRPYLNTKYEDYEGDPLLFTNWVTATVKSADGQVYSDMLINVDVYKDIVLFKRDNQIFSFLERIVEMSVNDNRGTVVYKYGSSFGRRLPEGFYEILNADPLLLKSAKKTLLDVPGYGSNAKKKFAESKQYFATVGSALSKVSLTKSDAEKVFAPKWQAVSAYASKHGLSFKNEEAWRALLLQYAAL